MQGLFETEDKAHVTQGLTTTGAQQTNHSISPNSTTMDCEGQYTEQPPGEDKVTHSPVQPPGEGKVTHSPVQPPGEDKVTHSPVQPPGEDKVTHSPVQPPGEDKVTHSPVQPPGEDKVTHSPVQPPGEDKVTHSPVQPPGEDKVTHSPVQPPGTDVGNPSKSRPPPHATTLYFDIKDSQWPIFYTQDYNIGFLGLEKLHPFDAGKWGKVFEFLKESRMVREDTIVQPREAQQQDLLVVHTQRYLSELKWSYKVAAITEVPPVALLPNFVVQRRVLRPFRYHTGGTILAAKVALDRGWAINIGGGFHHCSASRGGGFCAYADITLAIRFLLDRGSIQKAMIIDLDAHQGNGHGRDFMNDKDKVYIMDVYNRGIYPHDGFAKRGITRKVELNHYTEDAEYLQKVRTNVKGSLNEFTPDLVVYNAGTDILDGDPLGCLSISPEGIVERDQIVFQECRTRGIPVVMVTSGGYQKCTARIIADSILNMHQLRLISCDEAENAPLPQEADPAPGMTRSVSDGGLWARFRSSCVNMTRSQTQVQLDES